MSSQLNNLYHSDNKTKLALMQWRLHTKAKHITPNKVNAPDHIINA